MTTHSKQFMLDRRIPLEDIEEGRAYFIHARNGCVGIARFVTLQKTGERQVEYVLHRVKFKSHYLFPEVDWDHGPPYGTAIPLRLLDEHPPQDRDEWLDWLAEQEEECKSEANELWEQVLSKIRKE